MEKFAFHEYYQLFNMKMPIVNVYFFHSQKFPNSLGQDLMVKNGSSLFLFFPFGLLELEMAILNVFLRKDISVLYKIGPAILCF
jgi:hypothetical protein